MKIKGNVKKRGDDLEKRRTCGIHTDEFFSTRLQMEPAVNVTDPAFINKPPLSHDCTPVRVRETPQTVTFCSRNGIKATYVLKSAVVSNQCSYVRPPGSPQDSR